MPKLECAAGWQLSTVLKAQHRVNPSARDSSYSCCICPGWFCSSRSAACRRTGKGAVVFLSGLISPWVHWHWLSLRIHEAQEDRNTIPSTSHKDTELENVSCLILHEQLPPPSPRGTQWSWLPWFKNLPQDLDSLTRLLPQTRRPLPGTDMG